MPEANRYQAPLRFERHVPPCAIVIFGANGDLTKRKLLPALYRLAYERRMPSGLAIIGNSRTAMSDDDFREKMRAAVKEFLEDSPFDEKLWDEFARGLYYLSGDLQDPDMYNRLGELLAQVEQERQTAGNVLFYLATQPSYYASVVEQLGQAGLNHGGGYRRVIGG